MIRIIHRVNTPSPQQYYCSREDLSLTLFDLGEHSIPLKSRDFVTRRHKFSSVVDIDDLDLPSVMRIPS